LHAIALVGTVLRPNPRIFELGVQRRVLRRVAAILGVAPRDRAQRVFAPDGEFASLIGIIPLPRGI